MRSRNEKRARSKCFRIVRFVFILLFVSIAHGCGAARDEVPPTHVEPERAPLTARAPRIVSLVPLGSAFVVALGGADQLVGVDRALPQVGPGLEVLAAALVQRDPVLELDPKDEAPSGARPAAAGTDAVLTEDEPSPRGALTPGIAGSGLLSNRSSLPTSKNWMNGLRGLR